MAEIDNKLGKEVNELLISKGIETPLKLNMNFAPSTALEYIDTQVYNILAALGMDLTDDSLKDTPKRVSKMFCQEIFGGLNYDNFPKATTIENKMGADEIVCVRDITLRSCCEHHLQPIYGRIHIGYIPGTKILGLSKFERIASFFGARPQVQERLGEQIFAALQHILETDDVAVVIDAEHFCMKMRGVKDTNPSTVTSKMGGRFKSNPAARAEFMGIIGK